MQDVVIVQAFRSPIGKKGGTLAATHPADVLGPVLMQLLRRTDVSPAEVDQVVGGCINKVGAQAMNITRTAWLSHGGAADVACTTVDSQCGSSQYALDVAFSLISAGRAEIVLACGVEIMSQLAIGSDAIAGTRARLGKPIARSYYDYFEFTSQFEAAERIATKYDIGRSDSDEFGLMSQIRAARAIADGRFDRQIVPIEVELRDETGARTGETLAMITDEIPRDTSIQALAALKPVARADGIHTAGTSSQIADGASGVLLMSGDEAERRNLTPLARVAASALVGCDPVLMLEGPIPATKNLMAATGTTIEEIDLFEINEAFAAIVLAWAAVFGPDMSRVNPNGGAIALGHPLGATGTFLVTKAVHELQRTNGRFALVSMCCGGGLGTGTLLERL